MSLIDFIFPKTCLACGKEGEYLCELCVEKVGIPKPTCPYCRHPSIDGATHINCSRKLGLDGIVSLWNYEGVIRRGILSLKYKYSTKVGEEISSQMVKKLRATVLPGVGSLTPVPIYWLRQNTRGFNQSQLVGKLVSDSMLWQYLPDLLIKTKSTISQVELSGEKRRKNLKDAFKINTQVRNPSSIFLFDDVFTTGSTLFEAGKALKRAGVEKVWGLTIAR